MTFPYWLYYVRRHTPNWSGWRFLAVRITWRPELCCEECGHSSRITYINAPVPKVVAP